MWTDLSIILPCYNEGNIIRQNIKKVIDYIETELPKISYEIIVVNDGSTDLSKRLLRRIDRWIPNNSRANIEVINYSPNRGKGYAIRKGIAKASGHYILFMDSDLSTSLDEIKHFWKNRQKADIIIGNRKLSESKIYNKSFKRKIVSFACNIITKTIVPIKYKDTQCGFKFFNRKAAKDIARRQTIPRFAFDVEYLYIAKLRDYSVLELPVEWNDRRDSKVKLSKSSIEFFKDLFKIRANSIRYRR